MAYFLYRVSLNTKSQGTHGFVINSMKEELSYYCLLHARYQLLPPHSGVRDPKLVGTIG